MGFRDLSALTKPGIYKKGVRIVAILNQDGLEMGMEGKNKGFNILTSVNKFQMGKINRSVILPW